MGAVEIICTTVAGLITLVAVVLAARAVLQMVSVIRVGQPDPGRLGAWTTRGRVMLTEIFGHTRMLKWSVVGAAHWFVMIAFMVLFLLVLEAYFEVVNPEGGLPIIGHWVVYGLVTEIIGVFGFLGILTLIGIRLRNRPGKARGLSRFTGSTMWQGYFVEWIIFAVLVCGFLIRGFKVANDHFEFPRWATPVSHWVGDVLPAWEAGPTVVAAVKIVVSMTWLIVIALNVTMGVAWHRFLAFPNIFFKRDPAKPAGSGLGGLRPMMSGGKPLDFEEADPEKDQFGVAQVEQFTWKGLLDFSTCTECGRCQSQCPAWNTGKPLSPKLLVLSLRDHAYAKAPYLLAGGGKDLTGEEKGTEEQLAHVDALAMAEAGRPLIGGAEDGGVIDPDVLWSCTTCGACVEQCPVDIEHVDHIVDMRRYQVLIESSFPAEAGIMLKNLESKGNPWGAPPNTRDDWTKTLDFDIKKAVSLGEGETFEYLLWVGCAGAFDDRAKRTSKAVATLLHEAGVDFAITGEGATCTGDPARRMGNEFVFQMLAQQNVEVFNEVGVKKIVATCPHCFNTLKNEYGALGGEYEVYHHTELLAHLVQTGKLLPVEPVDGGITFHDPCYLGRHNRVFAAPRALINEVGWAGGRGSSENHVTEMPRNSERSFCCGAGGARMWMEERIGKRINTERVEEALATGSKTIAVGCPFCSTMLGDGVTAKKSSGEAGEDVEVVDVATVLLRSIKTAG